MACAKGVDQYELRSGPYKGQKVIVDGPEYETTSSLGSIMLYAQRPAIQSGIAAVNRAVNPVLAASLSPEPAASANPLQILTAAACLVWLLGLAGMLVYTAVSYLRLHRQLAASVCIGGRVWLCDNVRTPFILGVARPRICLPSGMGEAEREPVVAHETAHLRRLDHIWKPLGFLLLAVYWFHPLCWLAYALFCRDLELACDESVVRTLDKRGVLAYSEALLACSAPHAPLGNDLAVEVGHLLHQPHVLHHHGAARAGGNRVFVVGDGSARLVGKFFDFVHHNKSPFRFLPGFPALTARRTDRSAPLSWSATTPRTRRSCKSWPSR